MKKGFAIFLITFYLSGTLFLPMGDFSVIKDLPDMYRHCRDTEDTDLNVFEFFTEHVSGIGQVIEGIEHESQKDDDGDSPHVPVSVHFQQQISYVSPLLTETISRPAAAIVSTSATCYDRSYSFSHIAFVFRPPIYLAIS